MQQSNGMLAAQAGYTLPLQVLRSVCGYYIGTQCDEGPVSRESVEYYRDHEQAAQALENGTWTQRTCA
ncbi:hypothetical protein [Escherichia coli]|uniref:hypothetical protein n=1 Tax=Escherichia coli TaxID=562 RepID=UPI0005E02AFA|nr:hypothetical protein [Escherichia coli]EBB6538531.1 hypothetical protein [Salmonella enterica]ECT9443024.1 hypothetical protein [Salmonella enterica subsp. enterica serovar Typhi]EBE3248111.1 hypothetical protein [Salmonella enterica]EDS1247936.1 hypothetical protein [Salmonella enterica]EEE2433249.1 hypothetical protein [Salmonella enterica subsp. enterica serovar Typhi]